MQIAWHESLKFGQLTLGKIITIVATICQILRLKCTKFNFGWGSAPDPAGGANSASPDPLAGLMGPTSKGRGRDGMGRGKGGNGKWRGREGTERGGRRTRPHPFTPPNAYFWIRPCETLSTYRFRDNRGPVGEVVFDRPQMSSFLGPAFGGD